MGRQRGTPDRRGMGAQSDFVAETFMPSEAYRVQQVAMMRRLSETGVSREQMEKLFLLPLSPLSGLLPAANVPSEKDDSASQFL